MTTDKYIQDNKTEKLKKGDKVVMHSCGEAKHYDGKIWECETDSYISYSGSEVIFLRNFSGSFAVKYLQRLEL